MSLKIPKQSKEAFSNRRSDMWVTEGIQRQKRFSFNREQTDATDAEYNHVYS